MANLRVRIDDGFETFGRWLYRNRFKTLLMMLSVVAAFVSQLPRLTFDTSASPGLVTRDSDADCDGATI